MFQLLLIIFMFRYTTAELYKDGNNVCVKECTEQYTEVVVTVADCGFQGWSSCTAYRSGKFSRTVDCYICCEGWTTDGESGDCDLAICFGLAPSGKCRNNGECVKPDVCDCPAGTQLPECEDIDECLDDNGGCNEICQNTIGSYECKCYPGGGLADDRTCAAICYGQSPGVCQNGGTCVSRDRCVCPPGTSEPICDDVNECEGDHGCQHSCLNQLGSYICNCNKGYGLLEDERNCAPICYDGEAGKCLFGNPCVAPDVCVCEPGFLMPDCADIDECADPKTNICDQDCVNVPGSFKCECRAGYGVYPNTKLCVDLDECALQNGGCSDTCVNTISSFHCVCPDGFRVGNDKKTCQDINECATKNGGCYLSCTNEEGSYHCECGHGYLWDKVQLACKPVCFGGAAGVCENGGTCSKPGVCSCLPGFLPPRCTDVNECNQEGVCQQTCENTVGSYICSCLPGYFMANNGGCIDIDECSTGDNVCVQGCTNIPGQYACACEELYGWHSESLSCKPVCFAEEPGRCANGGECVAPGTCLCKPGFKEPQCTDVNECGVNNGGCELSCTNTLGSYICDCYPGYTWVPLTQSCEPVCYQLEPSTCLHDGVCIEPGVCQCSKGYGGKMCSDVDECSEGLASCNYYRCHNTMGSYYCDCKAGLGWNQHEQLCMADCSYEEPGLCPNGGTCTTAGQCTCQDGYQTPDCSDINECTNSGCEHQCYNTPGSYYCGSRTPGYGRLPGKTQDKAICFGLLPGECPNEGTCATPDVCSCPLGYYAPRCDAVDSCEGRENVCGGECVSVGHRFYCQSEPGYGRLPGSDKNLPICFSLYPGECANDGVCIKPDLCKCPDGYYPPQCDDVNECAVDNGGCEKECINLIGSYYCQCSEGYGISPGEEECKPICFDSKPGSCHGGGKCVSPDTCICAQGYEGETCADINECVNGVTVCELECHNTLGSYACDCPNGLGWDEVLMRCRPVCNHGKPGLCPNGGLCIEPETCECLNGYHADTCEDIDECISDVCERSCVNIPGQYYCLSDKPGYGRVPGENIDKPICDADSLPGRCANGGECIEPDICQCPKGYDTPGCTDIDECLLKSTKCSDGCKNIPGSYYCMGENGFGKAPGDTIFKPVCGDSLPGECANGGTCIRPGVCSCAKGFLPPDCTVVDDTCDNCPASLCINLQGADGCRCATSFQENDKGVCSGRLPCDCKISTDCISPKLCSCATGFEGPQCSDIDECVSSDCELGCVNIPGLYYCESDDPGYGYRPGENFKRPLCFGELPGSCANGGECKTPGVCSCTSGYNPPDCTTDVDECSTGDDVCQTGGCHNEIGSYRCDCPKGYAWDDQDKTCKASCYGEDPGTCANGGTCIRPWVCDCKPGFTSPDCSDIIECSKNNGGCTGMCHNTIGSYYCDCPPNEGWNTEMAMCKPTCLGLPPGECPNGGECISSEICRCKEGYSPPECTDIDECSGNSPPCEDQCENIPGAYYCTDGSGFGFLKGQGEKRALCYMLPPGICPNDGTCIEPEKCQCAHGFIPPDCSDKNECLENNGGCDLPCHNTKGSYYCECPRGFGWSKDDLTCKPVCFGLPPGSCPNGGTCLPGQICSCLPGFTTPDCADIDECALGENTCELGCNNLHGSYSCDCQEGYIWKQKDKQCLPVCYGLVGSCLNDGVCVSPSVCDCKDGFSQPKCADINECAVNNGGCERACSNLRGSYQCSCITGYKYDDKDKRCKALCGNNPIGTCPQGGTCVSPGDCVCLQGYDPLTLCQDIDECAVGDICSGQPCVNTDGSYFCRCDQRDYGKGPTDTQCKPICYPNYPGICPNGGTCTSPETCQCAEGYQAPNCGDINECELDHGCERGCINEDGGYKCQCYSGYEWDKMTKTCKPSCFDEDPGLCPNGGECITPGQCQCADGYQSPTCEDIDECERDDVYCEFGCVNIPGTYYCLSDKPGYGKNPGEKFIKPICNGLRPGTCSHGGICFSPDTCSCPTGFQQVLSDCQDIDECSLANKGGCEGHCTNLIGSYECSCQLGYGWDGQMKKCRAVCDGLDPGKCPNGGDCLRPGVCQCLKGFQEPDCSDINECETPEGEICERECFNRHGFFYCSGSKPGYGRIPGEDIDRPVCVESEYPGSCPNAGECILPDRCRCEAGFKQPECEDIDECETKPDSPDCLECINTVGSYFCNCEAGYDWNIMEQACTAVCFELPPGECPNGGSCIEPYVCSCLPGFTGIRCDDIDECGESVDGCSQICENLPGSFSCLCNNGYTLSTDLKTCIDTDECAVNNGDCPQKCINVEGTFSCVCGDGYKLSGTGVGCTDINECALQNGGCDESCVNTEGSYKCDCGNNRGVAPDGKTCAAICYHYDPGTCGTGGICVETDTCQCSIGYLEPYCNDIDECLETDHGCSSKCKNTDGSYVCTCEIGYALGPDQRTCEDVDECSSVDRPCSHTCVNVEGSYLCFCPSGYTMGADQHNCIGEDPCSMDNGGCLYQCVNSQNGVECTCFEGYKSTGLDVCVDEDECTTKNGGCESLCFNTQGSWRCGCQPGLRITSDGHSCERCTGDSVTECLPVCAQTEDNQCDCPDGYFPHPDGQHCQGGCPCQNKGHCESELPLYKCDCAETGYKGDLCTIPTVSTPAQVNLRPYNGHVLIPIVLVPKIALIIRANSDPRLVFSTNPIVIKTPSTRNYFNVTSNTSGIFQVDYLISGVDQHRFEKPSPTKLISGNIFERLELFHKELPLGCFKLTLTHEVTKTPLGKHRKNLFKYSLVFLSTSHWLQLINRSDVFFTYGVVHSTGLGDMQLPLHESGIEIVSREDFLQLGPLSPYREERHGKKVGHPTKPTCKEIDINQADIALFTRSKSLLRSLFRSLRYMMPNTLRLAIADEEIKQPYIVQILVGYQVRKIPSCQSTTILDNSLYHVYRFQRGMKVRLFSQAAEFYSKNGQSEFCLVLTPPGDGHEAVHLNLPQSLTGEPSGISFMNTLDTILGSPITLQSFSMSPNGHLTLIEAQSHLWNGQENFTHVWPSSSPLSVRLSLERVVQTLGGVRVDFNSSLELFFAERDLAKVFVPMLVKDEVAMVKFVSLEATITFTILALNNVLTLRGDDLENAGYLSIGVETHRKTCVEDANPPGLFFKAEIDGSFLPNHNLFGNVKLRSNLADFYVTFDSMDIAGVSEESEISELLVQLKNQSKQLTLEMDSLMSLDHRYQMAEVEAIKSKVADIAVSISQRQNKNMTSVVLDSQLLTSTALALADIWIKQENLEQKLNFTFQNELYQNVSLWSEYLKQMSLSLKMLLDEVGNLVVPISKGPYSWGFKTPFSVNFIGRSLVIDGEFHYIGASVNCKCASTNYQGSLIACVIGTVKSAELDNGQLWDWIQIKPGNQIRAYLGEGKDSYLIEADVTLLTFGIFPSSVISLTKGVISVRATGTLGDSLPVEVSLVVPANSRISSDGMKVQGSFISDEPESLNIVLSQVLQSYTEEFINSTEGRLEKASARLENAEQQLRVLKKRLNGELLRFTNIQNKLMEAAEDLNTVSVYLFSASQNLGTEFLNMNEICLDVNCLPQCSEGLSLSMSKSANNTNTDFPCFIKKTCAFKRPTLECLGSLLGCIEARIIAYNTTIHQNTLPLVMNYSQTLFNVISLSYKTTVYEEELTRESVMVNLTTVLVLELEKRVTKLKAVLEKVTHETETVRNFKQFTEKYSSEFWFSVKNCSFTASLELEYSKEIDVICSINPFESGWHIVTAVINLENVKSQLWKIAATYFSRIWGKIPSGTFKLGEEFTRNTINTIVLNTSMTLAADSIYWKQECETATLLDKLVLTAGKSFQSLAQNTIQDIMYMREVYEYEDEIGPLSSEESGVNTKLLSTKFGVSQVSLQSHYQTVTPLDNFFLKEIANISENVFDNVMEHVYFVMNVSLILAWESEMDDFIETDGSLNQCFDFYDCILLILKESFEDIGALGLPLGKSAKQDLNYLKEAFNDLARNKSNILELNEISSKIIQTMHVSKLKQNFCDVPSYSFVPFDGMYVKLGKPVQIPCLESNEMDQDIFWMKRGEYRKLSEENSLRFSSVRLSHTGKYRCTLKENLFSVSSRERELAVWDPPKASPISQVHQVKVVGDVLQLNCYAFGEPKPTYHWSSNTLQGVKVNSQPELQFDILSSQDQGLYMCEASNPHGNANSKEIFLDVREAKPACPHITLWMGFVNPVSNKLVEQPLQGLPINLKDNLLIAIENLMKEAFSSSIVSTGFLVYEENGEMEILLHPTECEKPPTGSSIHCQDWYLQQLWNLRQKVETLRDIVLNSTPLFSSQYTQFKFNTAYFAIVNQMAICPSGYIKQTEYACVPNEAKYPIGPPINLTHLPMDEGAMLDWSPPHNGRAFIQGYDGTVIMQNSGEVFSAFHTVTPYYHLPVNFPGGPILIQVQAITRNHKGQFANITVTSPTFAEQYMQLSPTIGAVIGSVVGVPIVGMIVYATLLKTGHIQTTCRKTSGKIAPL